MKKRLGIAIVGVGGIAVSHMAALRVSERAELVCVQDMDYERAKQVAAEQGCRVAETLEQVLQRIDVQAVIVCTPNLTHAEIGARVLNAGRHLLMEKPLAMTVDDAEALAALAADRGLVLAVGHSHRFSAQSLAVQRLVAEGAVGEPTFVRVVMNGGWIWPGWQSWVLNPVVSGGHSLHNGVHLTDLASWWMGEKPDTVFAAGQRVTSGALDIADYLVIQLGFPGGAAAICEVSRAERPRRANYLELTVIGTEGVLTRAWDAEGIRAWLEEGLAMWSPDGAAGDVFVREIDSFAGAVRGEHVVEPPVHDAIDAVRVAAAAERSLATAQLVSLEGER
ncbi:Gfo/Idh/MocA family protein [Microbacterium arabinogalactanolyticum]|uniref:Gfo/Idh/MocA family protein n=1 Tax=Microbacterium arabinogalactanolyticum TaxID=69365 RepID=UPI0040444C96